MIAEIDTIELKKLAQEATLAERVEVLYVRNMLKSASFSLERRIKGDPPKGMPVKTRRASSSWGRGPEGVWEIEDGGLTITQGSNVKYIVYLNAGHSQQSPTGFIDMALVVAQLYLESKLALIDPTDANRMIRKMNAAINWQSSDSPPEEADSMPEESE
jgi:hypothetical protein